MMCELAGVVVSNCEFSENSSLWNNQMMISSDVVVVALAVVVFVPDCRRNANF